MLSHGNLLFNFEAANQVVDFYETDVFLSFLPLSHIYGRIVDEVVALGRGAAVVYAEALLERLPANMVEVKPTVMGSVPRLYERVYARVLAAVEAGSPMRQRIFHWAAGLGAQKYANHLAGRPDSPWLRLQLKVADALVFKKIRERTGGRVRYFVSGSAPLAREIGEFFYGMGMLVLEGYGLTETSPFVSINRPDDFVFGTVGRAGAGLGGDDRPGDRRDPGARPAGHAGLPQPAGGDGAGDRLRTAGSTPATSASSTRSAASGSPIGSRTSSCWPTARTSRRRRWRRRSRPASTSPRRWCSATGSRTPARSSRPTSTSSATWAAANGLAEMPPEQLIEEQGRREAVRRARCKRTLDGFADLRAPAAHRAAAARS